MRTEEQFARAHTEAQRLANMHNKSFWLIPTKDSYRVSCFKEERDIPEHISTLEVTPVDELKEKQND